MVLLRSVNLTSPHALGPCLFFHHERNIILSVHDDFTVVGAKVHMDWFQKRLEAVYECKCTGRLGAGAKDDREMRILNRVVRWTSVGLEYEADPRQVEELLEEFTLDEGCKSVATPGVKTLAQEIEEEKELTGAELTRFRTIAARAKY